MTYEQKKAAEAAGIIERQGWMQGRSTGPNNEVCALQALWLATSGSFGLVEKAMRRHLMVASLVDWNDTPGRTKEEVIAAFRRFAGVVAADPHERELVA